MRLWMPRGVPPARLTNPTSASRGLPRYARDDQQGLTELPTGRPRVPLWPRLQLNARPRRHGQMPVAPGTATDSRGTRATRNTRMRLPDRRGSLRARRSASDESDAAGADLRRVGSPATRVRTRKQVPMQCSTGFCCSPMSRPPCGRLSGAGSPIGASVALWRERGIRSAAMLWRIEVLAEWRVLRPASKHGRHRRQHERSRHERRSQTRASPRLRSPARARQWTPRKSLRQERPAQAAGDPQIATCATGRLAGHPGVVGDLAADPLCRGGGSRGCACWEAGPR